jgi:cell division protein FtsW
MMRAVLTGNARAANRSAGQHEVDPALLWSALILLLIGFVMVYSASIATAEGSRNFGHNPMYFLLRHGVYLSVGLVAAFAVFQVPVATWQKFAPWLFIGGVVLLAVVLVPGLGREVNGARRWLSLGVANLQPSELMKVFAVLYAADYTVRKMPVMNDLKRAFAPMAGAMVLVAGMLLMEPDFGAFVVIVCIAMGILFLGGMRAGWFFVLVLILLVAFLLMIWLSPYRRERIFGYMDPWADPFGKGYQLSHALIAFGRGEWFGVGLGASVEKLMFLPEAHTDFLLAVIAEEIGLVGVLVVLALFVWILFRTYAIARQAMLLDRPFAALTAQGIGVWIGVQAFINIGVNMGVLPTKGLTLPLLSFGGSGIVANCIAIAILLRVDYENRRLLRGFNE